MITIILIAFIAFAVTATAATLDFMLNKNSLARRRQFFNPNVYLAIIITSIGTIVLSWLANIITVFTTMGDPITGIFILRVVGIFVFPIGAIMGVL